MELGRKAAFSYQLTLTSFTALALYYCAWYLWLAPAQSTHPWVIWLIHLVPLAAFAPVIIKGSPRGSIWLCFVLMFYFLEAVLAAWNPQLRWLGIIAALLIALLFSSAMMFARWQGRQMRLLQENHSLS